MNFYSLNKAKNKASFKEATITGIAPDRGLYFPEKIPQISPEVFQKNYSKTELAQILIQDFVSKDIPEEKLQNILEETLNFPFPLVSMKDNNYILELFHGPTLAFKDVGARFMARCLGFFNENENNKVTVLVATSGDTGGAVADGFLNVDGVEVVILYPKGRVSLLQEKQLTTLGNNITALEVDGSFDDCQEMVKTAFLDQDITSKMKLTSANSINIARWMPQMFYYAFALQQLKEEKLVFSVPSGNFGNICAGMLLNKMTNRNLQFIASCNANDVIPKYLQNEVMLEQKSIATISNAMDVANPSNFVRIQALYNNNFKALQQDLNASTHSDHSTREMMQKLAKNQNYIADPHGAVAYLGLEAFKAKHFDFTGVALETAHPCKFKDVVEETIQQKVKIPSKLKGLMKKEKVAISVRDYGDLKGYLLS